MIRKAFIVTAVLLLSQVNISANKLLKAARENKLEEVVVLMDDRADVNVYDASNRSPLYWACFRQNKAMVKLLIDHCNEHTMGLACTVLGQTPLHLACRYYDQEIVEIVLPKSKSAINLADKDGYTPLYWACKNGYEKVVEALLPDCKPGIINMYYNEETLLDWACEHNKPEIIRLLFLYCWDTTIEGSRFGKTPLYWACKHANAEIVELLLSKCSQNTINRAYDTGVDMGTLLSKACEKNQTDVVKLLIPYCLPETINRVFYGKTPVYWACKHENIDVVELLLKKCSEDTLNKNYVGGTLLNIACKKNNTELVQLLFPYCLPETINRSGYGSPLGYVCRNNNVEAAELLIPHCRSEILNAEYLKETLLYWTCVNNHYEIIELLVENGAIVRQKDIEQVETREMKQYLLCAYLFQQSIDTYAFLIEEIGKSQQEKELSLELQYFLRLALVNSIRDFFLNETPAHETLFAKLYADENLKRNAKHVMYSMLRFQDDDQEDDTDNSDEEEGQCCHVSEPEKQLIRYSQEFFSIADLREREAFIIDKEKKNEEIFNFRKSRIVLRNTTLEGIFKSLLV